jgi:predicted CXXCH cytochrome family protein
MEKSIARITLLVMIVVVSMLMAAQIAKAGVIAGTKHDLTSVTGSGQTEICVFCHTPHFSGSTAPLWNRTNSATYTMYTSATMDMAQISGNTPGGVSAACLSCHDGVQAYDALVNRQGSGLSGTVGTVKMTGASTMLLDGSSSLTNDHPISIIYNPALDTKFTAITTPGAKGANVGTLPLYGAGFNQVECASCHNVHDNANAPFLRLANTGSALCLKCHDK